MQQPMKSKIQQPDRRTGRLSHRLVALYCAAAIVAGYFGSAAPAYADEGTGDRPAGHSETSAPMTQRPQPDGPAGSDHMSTAPPATTAPSPVPTDTPTKADPEREDPSQGEPATAPAQQGEAATAPMLSLEEEIGERGSFMGQSLIAQQKQLDVQAAQQSQLLKTRGMAAQAGDWKAPGVNGMDVSGWQSNVNWDYQWDLGARFAYVKATEGDAFTSDTFNRQYIGAYNAGMMRGAYHFALPQRGNAASQARFFVNNGGAWSPDGKTLPPLLDIEHNPYKALGNMCYDMGANRLVTWIKNFSEKVESMTGRQPMIYTSHAWWTTCTNNTKALSDHALHVAAYPYPGYEDGFDPLMFGGWNDYTVWQYSFSGPFAGDSNKWNGTYKQLKAFARGSAGSSPAPEPEGPNRPESFVRDRTEMVVAPGDFDGDRNADLLHRLPGGDLVFYPGNGNGGYGQGRQIGRGWNIYDLIVGVGDYDGDGHADLVGRRSDGTLWFYAGSGSVSAGYDRKVQIGVGGWSQFSQVIGAGDVTGDNVPDLLGVRDDGLMYLYAGTGKGDQERRVRAGTNWDRFDYIFGPGDFNTDGKTDLYARQADGTLWFIPGTGRGNFTAAEQVGVGGWSQFSRIMGIGDNNRDRKPDILAVGKNDTLSFYAGTGMPNPDGHKPGIRIGSSIWDAYTEILTPGDFNGDNKADIIARRPNGTLWFMAGNGQPGHAAPRQIGRGWNMHNKIIGAGDYDNNGTNDLIARDKDGSLWFYAGTGTVNNHDNGLERRVKIGVGGWNQFVEILGTGDFDGNRHNDLLGIRNDGTLSFYSGNGTGKSTGERTQMGRGWDMYDKYIAPGDYNGDNKADIIAAAPDGTLWLYPGTGKVTNTNNGYQTPRTKIGIGGWTKFNHLLGIKDFNTDRKNDIIGIDKHGRIHFYEGTHMNDKGYQPHQPAGTL